MWSVGYERNQRSELKLSTWTIGSIRPQGTKLPFKGWNNLTDQGIVIVAPSFNYLLAVDNSTQEIVPSTYAVAARAAGLKIITWSIERSGPLANVAANKDSYYTTLYSAIKTDGQLYEVIDALAQKVKVLGIFADWPATVTYYASCMGLKGGFQDKDRN